MNEVLKLQKQLPIKNSLNKQIITKLDLSKDKEIKIFKK